MRHNRRNSHLGQEFGGSGEDSFVAVVVTKLTGALLFILLLTMVIMALLPKAVDLPSSTPTDGGPDTPAPPVTITTPEMLPEAIVGHPYAVALAAKGGRGAVKWSLSGLLPEGLTFDPETGRIQGTPIRGTPKPAELVLSASDATSQSTQISHFVVYQTDRPLTTPVWWKPGIPPIPWQAWVRQGFGFLLLWLVHVVGVNTLTGLERWRLGSLGADTSAELLARTSIRRRFLAYRFLVRIFSLSAFVALAAWLRMNHA